MKFPCSEPSGRGISFCPFHFAGAMANDHLNLLTLCFLTSFTLNPLQILCNPPLPRLNVRSII